MLAVRHYVFYNVLAMKVVFMGTPYYVIPVLNSIQAEVDVIGVYTAPDRPKGKGGRMIVSPVKENAAEKNIRVYQPTTLRSEPAYAAFRKLSPDLVVVAAYGQIIPSSILGLPKYGFVNLHPSLLPKYRGASPVVSALLDGVMETGVTLLQLGEGVDDGPILAQAAVNIEQEEDAENLTGRLFEIGTGLLTESGLLQGKQIPQIPQDEAGATFTKKVKKEDGKARWGRSAVDLERQARAFTPWPSLFSSWEGRLVKLRKVHAIARNHNAAEGTVIAWEDPDLPVGIVTGKGVLLIEMLQIEGKRTMSSEQFLRGHKDFVGSVLPG